MAEAYIVGGLRSPICRRGGSLAGVHPADLAAYVVRALIDKSGVDPNAVDDVLLGCLDRVGPQASNIARTAWLAADLPEHVPGTTIDRQCGSSQQALHFAAQAVMSGVQDLVVAGGVQSMSLVPMGTSRMFETDDVPDAFEDSRGWVARYGDQEVSQFVGAELIAERWSITRAEMEEFAVTSHGRAIAAQEAGRFDTEITAVDGVRDDEGPRVPDLDKIRSLPPLRPEGRITAALASQMSDGAAALLVASEPALSRFGLRPRARVHHMTVVGDDPITMLTGPIPGTRRALERTGLDLDDIDLIEMNEAFASVVIAWERDVGADRAKTNVNGGALALGHPLGATGARLMVTLLHELERRSGRFGLQVMCEGGGTANVTIIERL